MTSLENYYSKDGWTLKKINEAVTKSPIEFINSVELTFDKQIKEVVDCVERKQPECKILMVAGPSSSGKTTTANMIKNELMRRGIWSTVISLDDFYVGIAKLPILSNGDKDFESINGLDIVQIKKCLKGIVYDNFCDMPIYDFSTMAPSQERRHIKVPENGIIIIEGLHALNPTIIEDLPSESILRIYVSVQNGVMLEDGKDISPQAIRLTRRVLRDYNYRYTLPIRTIMMWNNVCRGEELYIKPFMIESDLSINSFHAYELCVMAEEMIELMGSIPENVEIYSFVKRLSNKLKRFKRLDDGLVPETSLLKEFVK